MKHDPMQAYHRGFFGEKYVPMTIGGFEDDWWRKSTNSSCGPEILDAVLFNGFDLIPAGYQLKSNESEPAISGWVSVLTHERSSL